MTLYYVIYKYIHISVSIHLFIYLCIKIGRYIDIGLVLKVTDEAMTLRSHAFKKLYNSFSARATIANLDMITNTFLI